MSAYDDKSRYEEEDAFERLIEGQLRQLSENPVVYYLARYGDAIEKRVHHCRSEADALATSGFHGAALVRYTTAIEIAIRFFLVRPLLQGSFLSDEWAALLLGKILKGPSHLDRKLLPAILQNWNLDVTKLILPDGTKVWEQILSRVWPRRNDYVHSGNVMSEEDSLIAAQCLDVLLRQLVAAIATRFGFTREETGCWSVVLSKQTQFVSSTPTRFETDSPFRESTGTQSAH